MNIPVSQEARLTIENRLLSIAAEHKVNILYACESGSRAWGFPSPDSDCDVRFIYAHPLEWYLKLNDDSDVIDLALEDTPAGLLDIGGWDLRKTLRLLSKSNPVIWEWLQSPVIYRKDLEIAECRHVFDPFFSPITACHHYLSICRNTMTQAFDGETVRIKKYFYMLRPLLAALWIERYRSVPPMELALLLPVIDEREEIQQCICDLQVRKQHIDEQVPIARVAIMDDFLVSESERLQDAAKRLPAASGDPARLDGFFQQCLGLA